MNDELINHVQKRCNRYVNGECLMLRCLRRGGWKKNDPVDLATCEEHEIVQQLLNRREREREIESLREQVAAYKLGFDQINAKLDKYITMFGDNPADAGQEGK